MCPACAPWLTRWPAPDTHAGAACVSKTARDCRVTAGRERRGPKGSSQRPRSTPYEAPVAGVQPRRRCRAPSQHCVAHPCDDGVKPHAAQRGGVPSLRAETHPAAWRDTTRLWRPAHRGWAAQHWDSPDGRGRRQAAEPQECTRVESPTAAVAWPRVAAWEAGDAAGEDAGGGVPCPPGWWDRAGQCGGHGGGCSPRRGGDQPRSSAERAWHTWQRGTTREPQPRKQRRRRCRDGFPPPRGIAHRRS